MLSTDYTKFRCCKYVFYKKIYTVHLTVRKTHSENKEFTKNLKKCTRPAQKIIAVEYIALCVN